MLFVYHNIFARSRQPQNSGLFSEIILYIVLCKLPIFMVMLICKKDIKERLAIATL